MGLDNYFTFQCGPNETAPVVSLPRPIKLWGGMMSGGEDCSSFRGKVYAPAVEKLTGFDLYADEITPVDCQVLGSKLRMATSWVDPEMIVDPHFELKAQELRDLGDVFSAYGDAGFSCVSWY